MYQALKATLVVAALWGAQTAAFAKQPVVLANTDVQSIKSKINGVDYQITVVLPTGYDKEPSKHYPTLYVMDGNRWGQLLAVLYPRFTANAGYPPIIIVGIDYPQGTGRYQDYGPVSKRYFDVPPERGVVNFMRVVKEELIPFIDKTYRTDTRERAVGGHSLGGFFAAYSLLHAADTFNRFWISSPSLFYDDELLFKDFAAFRHQKINQPLYVFTDVGGDEMPGMINALGRFGEAAREAHPNRVILENLVVQGADHATVVPSVLAPALEHMFKYRKVITPVPADLMRYAGKYRLPNGTVITLVNDGAGLLYGESTIDYAETGSLVRLRASAPNRFYQRGSPRELEFVDMSGMPPYVRVIDVITGEVLEALRLKAAEQERPDAKIVTGVP